MANNGFSAVVNYWGSITGLTPKSSSDGKTASLAEAVNSDGDTVAHDVYGEVMAPSVEYAVTAEVDLSDISLGSVVTYNSTKKLMITSVTVATSAGTMPTVTISGIEVESAATSLRTYEVTGTVLPRAKAQDVCSAFGTSANFTSISTTITVDGHVQTVAGTPVGSDAAHGKIEAQATLTDPAGTGTITAGTGFTITAPAATSDPDADYQTLTATATKFITGTEADD